MARTAGTRALPEPLAFERPLDGRLGLNVPDGWWPTAATLKSIEAAGFGWVQVLAPPSAILRGAEARRHADALRAALDVGGLEVVVHAPFDLRGDDARALECLLEYSARVGAAIVVHHAANRPPAERSGLTAEVAALRRAGRLAATLDIVVAAENLAPVYPGERRLCHDPAAVAALVEHVACERVRMCFDVGHAHITGTLDALDAALAHVALFHVHDNLGDRRVRRGPATVDPLRLDLHLPPGTGTLPWARLAPALSAHAAPLQLEVHPPHRPEPVGLATVTAELLGGSPSLHTHFTGR